MLTIATLLWEPNGASRDFSRCYDATWVEKLYRGFRRNLTVPFRFVLFTDRERNCAGSIEEIIDPALGANGYADCIRPYCLGEPMILIGLDTIVTGNIDHLAEYCLTADRPAYPVDPYHPEQVCNGVGLVPAGWRKIGGRHRGENDMEWVRRFPHARIDTLFPGQVVSYKSHVKKRGIGDARIVFFHGQEKPHQLPNVGWVKEHWI